MTAILAHPGVLGVPYTPTITRTAPLFVFCCDKYTLDLPVSLWYTVSVTFAEYV